MTAYNFDHYIERRNTDSAKWGKYEADVLPMWVADMDFRSPEPILEALRTRIDQGVFGYRLPATQQYERICHHLWQHYDWAVTPDQILFMPGIISSFNTACRAVGEPGDGILVQPPVYFPILSAPANHGLTADMAELSLTHQNGHLHYEIDYEVFEGAITPQTRLFLLCNPHNPVGRSYTRAELTAMAEICARHDLIICSDEIHCQLMMAGNPHLPLAAIHPEIADRCITLMAPSKTFNIPSLGFSFVVIQNPDLLARFKKAMAGIVPHTNLLGVVAAMTAYTACDEWLEALLAYLTANRDFAVDYINQHLPGLQTTVPEATYLLWLDCRDAKVEGSPAEFFLENARVGLSEGDHFGPGGAGFVRLNYGCPRATLVDGLQRLRQALTA